MISFHFVSTCVICASEGPGRQEILRRRYLVGLVGVATLVNRQETGNYQAERGERDLTAAPRSKMAISANAWCGISPGPGHDGVRQEVT